MEKIVRLDRTWNAMRNIFWGIIDKIITLVFPFIIRTILIKVLGMEYAGLDGLFTSILSVLNLSELGFSTAIVYCMYKPIAYDDKQTICALLNLFRKMYFFVGTFVMIIGTVLMPFLKFFINGTYPDNINLYLIYGVYLINSCVSYFFMGYRSAILSAHQRLDITQKIICLVKGMMYVVQIGILLYGGNYYVYVIVIPFFTIMVNLLTAYEAKKVYPQYYCKGRVSKNIKKDLQEKLSGLMITKLCAVTRNSFDSIFISTFLGLSVSAIYSNYYFMMQAVNALLNIVVQAVLAGVGNSIQTESKEHNYCDLKRFNFMYLWIAGVCAICMFSLYQPFMKMWMGEDNLLPISSVALFCLYFFLLKIGDIQSVYYNAAGLWWHYRKCTVVEAVLNLILNFILGKSLGLNGIIAGTLISLFLVNFLYAERLVFKFYFKNGKTKEFYLQQIKYFIVTMLTGIFTHQICVGFVSKNISYPVVEVCIDTLVCFISANIIFWKVYRKTEEFSSAYIWILKKVKTFLQVKL